VKALILNSGRGERLRPLTKYIPKALIKIGDKPLLGYQISNLVDCGIRNIIMTTGPFENKIRKYMKKEYPEINVAYVKNPKYRTTNYIYSMWLTKKLIDDDIILFHGDLFFEKKLLKKLIEGKYANCVLVNRKIKPPKKDFKAVIENDIVIKIGVAFCGKNAFFSAPMYKFSKSNFLHWLNEIENSIKKRENLRIYAECILNEISDKIILHPVYFVEDRCLEIDTAKDLELVRSYFKRSLTDKK
jgi:choline kinase